MKRREFIKFGLAGTTVSFLPGLGLISCTKNILEPRLEPVRPEFCSPIDLPEEQGGFYVEYINGKDYLPTGLKLDTWQLKCYETIEGKKGKEISPNYDEIMRIIEEIKSENPDAEETFFNTFQCVGNIAGGNLISNGYFTGIPLRLFLERLGIDLTNPRVNRVYFRCFDGYHTNHKIERILNDDPSPIYFVYKFNGISLGDLREGCLKHGYPVRLVVQEMLGMKSPKGLVEIEITDRDTVDGWWETRSIDRAYPDIMWADIPPLKVNSKIFDPVDFQKVNRGATHFVQGIAVGGIYPVEKIEIGVSKVVNGKDSAISWEDARLASGPMDMDRPVFDDSMNGDFMEALERVNAGPWPAPFVWCLWEYQWNVPTGEGKYKLHARATDTAGNIQPITETPQERADGVNSIHSVLLQVM